MFNSRPPKIVSQPAAVSTPAPVVQMPTPTPPVVNTQTVVQPAPVKPPVSMLQPTMNHHHHHQPQQHHHHPHHHHNIKQSSFLSSVPAATPQAPQISAPPTIPTTNSVSNPSSVPIPPQMPKSVYDSLAPLDIPSKPVVYVDESSSGASTANATEGNIKPSSGEDSSRDEKAKLESILLGKMMEKGTAAGMMMMDGSSGGSGGTSSHHAHMTARFLGGKWPRNNMMQPGQAAILANRPLPPNYVCTICKKPGHHKQLCPEAVS